MSDSKIKKITNMASLQPYPISLFWYKQPKCVHAKMMNFTLTNPQDPFPLQIIAQNIIVNKIQAAYFHEHWFHIWEYQTWNNLLEQDPKIPPGIRKQLKGDPENKQHLELWRKWIATIRQQWSENQMDTQVLPLPKVLCPKTT